MGIKATLKVLAARGAPIGVSLAHHRHRHRHKRPTDIGGRPGPSRFAIRKLVETPNTGLGVPTFFYGTAWKKVPLQRHFHKIASSRAHSLLVHASQGVVILRENGRFHPIHLSTRSEEKERTAELTAQAIRAGYRAIDTANQEKHYNEAGAGDGVAAAGLDRHELWLQSKFSHGQWKNSELSFREQVKASVAASLEHLGTDYLDSLLLHGPLDKASPELPAGDWEVWRAMEDEVAAENVRSLGISNVNAGQLRELLQKATVKPEFVQTRCRPQSHWDAEVRAVCREHGLVYQGYSLLTANKRLLRSPTVVAAANAHHATPEQVVFRFAFELGIVPLTGTGSADHLAEDLAVYDAFDLDEREVAAIDSELAKISGKAATLKVQRGA